VVPTWIVSYLHLTCKYLLFLNFFFQYHIFSSSTWGNANRDFSIFLWKDSESKVLINAIIMRLECRVWNLHLRRKDSYGGKLSLLWVCCFLVSLWRSWLRFPYQGWVTTKIRIDIRGDIRSCCKEGKVVKWQWWCQAWRKEVQKSQ